jgi:3-methyladenine DNA glycosylase AlkC
MALIDYIDNVVWGTNHALLLSCIEEHIQDLSVVQHCLHHYNTPVEILELFSKHDNKEVRKLVFSAEKCNEQLLLEGVKDKEWSVRLACLKSNKSTLAVLEALINDENFIIRKEITSNYNLQVEHLLVLKEDKSEIVRKSAEQTLNNKFKYDLKFIAKGI